MRKEAIIIFLLIIFAFLFFSFFNITGHETLSEQREPTFKYRLLFCSNEDCLSELVLLASSGSADCALYNIHPKLANLSSPRFVVDSNSKVSSANIRKDNSSRLMHNKFCIINNSVVLTGSFNPLSSKADRNNMLIINSPGLARNYNSEFSELWNWQFSKGEKTISPKITLNNSLVESYFCPEDKCAEKLISVLNSANLSIKFMAYSFTHKGIANSLIFANNREVKVDGVIDSSNDKDIGNLLKFQGINISVYSRKGILHHKVFIIDERIVATGSFNPTYSGDERNDENLLIIHNSEIASKFIEEFNAVNQP